MSGAFAYKMTVNLGCLNPHAIRSLKKVFKVILQSTFWHRFSFGCPSYISNIRSLSFLPHALGSEGGWRQISVSFLCHALEITTQDLNVYCESPLSIRSRYPTGHWIAERALEHRLSTHQGLPTRLRHLSCWNINSWQYPKPPQGDSKMRWVKRLVRKGPVLLQETKWTGGQEEILAQHLPGVTVCSAPPIYTELGNPSGGTTVLVPAGWQVGEKTVLIPGKAVAVLLTDRCCQFYLVSVYLHPDHAKEDLRELVRAWTHFDKVTSRALLCRDFNRADSADKEGWEQFLHRAALCDVAPYLQTHVSPNAVSSLDRCLISEDWISSAQWNPLAKATHTMNFGHKIVQLQLRIRPTVLNNPRHPKHEIIPASVFMPGKDGNPAGAGTEALQSLIRLLHRTYHQCIAQSLLAPGRETCYFLTAGTDGDTWNAGEVLSSSPGCTSYSLVFPKHDDCRVDVHSQSTSGRRNVSGLVNSHLSISACFWAWWKTQPNPKQNETVAPAWLARKYLGGQSQYVNVPKEVVHDLINRSKGVVLADTGELTACGSAFVLPRLKLYDMLEVIDTLHSGSGYLPIDETNAQARGVGNMVAFWERMRSVCPRISTYNGPILTREGAPCRTAEGLDAAMLATREFWFEPPIAGDVQWESVLDAYGSAMPWPSFPPPGREVFLHTLLHTKDSSPGPDGIPYAAWRLLPEATVMAMDSYLLDILNGSALPPVQVGVWIPKAKLGPTADFFRPLGMPNTIDRLVDGAIATQAMKHTSHLMHPSQTVMSLFKEPQRAVAAVQQILDSDTAAAAILIDLSKAFERVNPHWILRLLRIKRAPHWIVTYARFVLFGRRVTHKVQGRLLPSRAILQGVDMGRSFSVYLFCLAMDPVFHYLNGIPGVISVQGYVDDTTIVGSAENAEWLCDVSRCYQQLRTAGFVVDGHSCYRSCRNSCMKFPARLLTGEELLRYWPQIDQAAKFPTATTALEGIGAHGYSVLLCRLFGASSKEGGIIVNLSFQQTLEICQGRNYSNVLALLAQGCTCKSKCAVITNTVLRTLALHTLENTQYGAHSIVASTPALGLVLFSRKYLASNGRWQNFVEPEELSSFHARSFGKFTDRLRLFSRPQISIQARCVAFNTFIQSVMLYAISYFGITSKDLNFLRQAAVKLVLKRHWLDAEIMPYVLRYVGIATVTDPALAATISTLGLFLRQGGDPTELWLEGRQERQMVATRILLDMWLEYVPLEQLRVVIFKGKGDPRRTVCLVKNVICQNMVLVAQTVLRNKVSTEGWIGGITFRWLEGLTKVPKKMCNGIARYAVLRWALNQDDDHWLANRGTRHQNPCARCGKRADCFPWGFYAAPMCETCVGQLELTSFVLTPYAQDLFLCLAHPGALSPGVTGQAARVDPHLNTIESLTDPQHQEHQNSPTHQQRCSDLENRLPDNNLVCIACGCGDCTVGHWVRWCLIPIASAHRLLGLQEYRGSLDVLAGISSRNLAICSLVVFHFRRLLRQEGAFFHQTRGERHSPLWWCRKLCHEVSLNAHIQLQVRIEEFRPGVPACTCSDEGVYLVRTLPVHLSTFLRPPLVVQAARGYEAGDTLAKVCLSSITLAALQATAQNVQGTNHNVLTSYYLCRCGEYHVEITCSCGE